MFKLADKVWLILFIVTKTELLGVFAVPTSEKVIDDKGDIRYSVMLMSVKSEALIE